MSLIRFNDTNTIIEVGLSVTKYNDINRVRIEFESSTDIPEKAILLGGFVELNEHNYVVQGDFSKLINLYDEEDNGLAFVLSDIEGDIKPEEVVVEPTVVPELTEEEKAAIEKQNKISELKNKVASLKSQIESTDYHIIKMYECSLIGQETEYDIAALHAERQELRNKVNELETQITALETA